MQSWMMRLVRAIRNLFATFRMTIETWRYGYVAIWLPNHLATRVDATAAGAATLTLLLRQMIC